jgi:four helix bundle protein
MTEKEFFSKLCNVVEEADETEYWLEVIKNASLSRENKELKDSWWK